MRIHPILLQLQVFESIIMLKNSRNQPMLSITIYFMEQYTSYSED